MMGLSVLLIFAHLLFSSSFCLAQSQLPAPDGSGIELTIATKSEVVKAGNDVLLDITIKNLHKDPYCTNETRENRHAELNGYVVEVIDAEGKLVPMTRLVWPRVGSIASRCVDPGKTFSKDMTVNHLVDISNPGIYHIRVSHRDKITNEIVWSNSITVTIEPPS